MPIRKKTSRYRYLTIPYGTLVYVAIRNLLHRKLRSLLTLFGIVIGIGAIYFLVSFGLGLQHIVVDQVIGSQSLRTVDIRTPNSRILTLNADAVEKITGLPNVSAVGTSYLASGTLSVNNGSTDIIAYGTDTQYLTASNLTLAAGALPKKGDSSTALINRPILEVIGVRNAQDAIGQKLPVKIDIQQADGTKKQIDETVTVAGVIEAAQGAEVFISGELFSKADAQDYSDMKVVVDDTANLSGLRQRIESMGFETYSAVDTIEQVNLVFRYLTIALVVFGAIGLIVAILGMFNTLTISLLERTREIGLMKVLGGRRKDMRHLFMLEAGILSFIGAILGVIAAIAIGVLAEEVFHGFSRSRGITESFSLFAHPLWLAIGLVVTMLIIGLMVALMPARRAERVNPVEALKRG